MNDDPMSYVVEPGPELRAIGREPRTMSFLPTKEELDKAFKEMSEVFVLVHLMIAHEAEEEARYLTIYDNPTRYKTDRYVRARPLSDEGQHHNNDEDQDRSRPDPDSNPTKTKTPPGPTERGEPGTHG